MNLSCIAAPRSGGEHPIPGGRESGRIGRLKRIAIDLTPIRPGGENGGAKPLALTLIQSLAELRPDTAFLLLTSKGTHEELSFLDRQNVRRICAKAEAEPARGETTLLSLGKRIAPRLPYAIRQTLNAGWNVLARDVPRLKSLSSEKPDLIFCPFTSTIFRRERIPIAALVHDLQFATYPQFFEASDLDERRQVFRWVCERANRIICPSNYVQNRVFCLQNVEKTRVKVLKNTVHTRFCQMQPAERLRHLASLQLAGCEYFLYPANFWPHKNHEMLVTAFAMLLHRRPDLDARLVLSGAPGARESRVRELILAAGLGERVHMPGYVGDEAFTALMEGCAALVFPSLYEGFGMPVLEAMSMGRPVVCGNRTALPEVAGDAALLVDPRSPFEIAEAMERVLKDEALATKLSAKGRAHAATFGDSREMAHEYLKVFEEAVSEAMPAQGRP